MTAECRPPPGTPDGTVYRVLVVRDVRGGSWHDQTWYRIGQQFDCVPNKPPYSLGWRTIHPEDPYGSIAAEHAIVLSRTIATPPEGEG